MSVPAPAQAHHQRSRARAWAVQILYQWESAGTGNSPEVVLGSVLASRIVNPERIPHLRRIVERFAEHRTEVDRTISDALDHWTFDRLGRVDRQVLRVGSTELLYCPDVPKKAAIHEAVRLAERYGSDESPRFVNGILDAVAQSVTPRSERNGEAADG